MELIFLERSTLEFKDYAFISDEFNLILDSVIYQKSYFVLNKVNINASIGDIVYLKNKYLTFIGIVETLELNNAYQTKVEVTDFSSIFDTKVKVTSFSGDLCEYLKDLIMRHFKTNVDNKQNLGYLTVTKSATVQGSVTFNEDTLMSITAVSEMLTKTYGIRMSAKIQIDDGKITGINVDVQGVERGLILKNNVSAMYKLSISDSTTQTVNKITFVPKVANTVYRNEISYYLLTDGTITTNRYSGLRYSFVKGVTSLYADNDYQSLETKAQEELLKSNLEHNISFTIHMGNTIIKPFTNLNLGDFVSFVAEKKTYNTMVTQLSFKDNYHECFVILGEYRVRLTEKLKLLERKN
ncbi:hypothetical protein LJC17_03035 [Acholeplasma sp. OttesenSCG-928-E16]|nr:hypothetical protein [Acholeplasma sp. OttesenSCG-928-E16]